MRRNHREWSESPAPISSRFSALQDVGCTRRSCLWPLERRLPCEASNAAKSLPEARGINSHLTTKVPQLHHLMHVALEDVGILTRGVSHQRLLEFNLRPVMVGTPDHHVSELVSQAKRSKSARGPVHIHANVLVKLTKYISPSFYFRACSCVTNEAAATSYARGSS